MNTYIEKTKELLKQSEPVQLSDLLTMVYDLCEKRENVNQKLLDSSLKQMEENLEGLCFAQADAVSCAVNAMCAEYDFAAFTDGFQKGAALILSLLC